MLRPESAMDAGENAKERVMSPEIDFFADDPKRFERFQREFRPQNLLGDLVNEVLDKHGENLKLREGEECDLSLLIAGSFGKGLKTFQAITRLCALGFGEDAIILLRSNVNLLINTRFVLSDEHAVERANEFIAYSIKERLKYLDLAHEGRRPEWMERVEFEEVERYADRWGRRSIEVRSRSVPNFHYTQGYRLYSSIEHSDAMALNAYITAWDETGPRIGSGPSDEFIGVALVHSFGVMADLLLSVMNHFGIQRADIGEKLKTTWVELGQEVRGT